MTAAKKNTKNRGGGSENRGASAKVHRYLAEHIGQVVFLHDMVQTLGLGSEPIRGAINYFRSAKHMNLQIITAGGSWKVNSIEPGSMDARPKKPADEPAAKPALQKRIFEEVGTTLDGTIIVQDPETMMLYRAALL